MTDQLPSAPGDRRKATEATLVSILVSCLACADQSLNLALPNIGDQIESLVFVYEGPERFEALALARDRQSSLKVDHSGEGIERVTLLLYETPLATLGLNPGILDLASQLDCASITLPSPEASFSTSVESRGAFVASDPPGWLSELKFTAICPCVDFDITPIDLGDRGGVLGAYDLDEHRALLVSTTQFFIIDDSGNRTDVAATPRKFLNVDRAPDGTLWLIERSGRLWSGEPTDLQMVTRSSTTGGWLAVSQGDPFEVFVMSMRGTFEHFDGQQWTVLYERPRGDSSNLGAVVWRGPGEAAASPPAGSSLLLYDQNDSPTLRWIEWPDLRLGPIGALNVVEGYDLLMATRGRLILQSTDGENWNDLNAPAAALGDRPEAFAAYGEGFVQVGGSLITQYHPNSSFCRTVSINTGMNLQQVAVIGGNLVVSGWPADGEGTTQAFLLRKQ